MNKRMMILAGLCWLAMWSGPAASTAAAEMSAEEIHQAVENLAQLNNPRFDPARLKALESAALKGTLSANDEAALCIGIISVPFAAAFGFGLVPNPPLDYLLGQLPAYAANLALKFCPPVLDAPPPVRVRPNVDTSDGSQCAYDFSLRRRSDSYSNFLGIPLDPVDDWTTGATAARQSLGQPTLFHYNSDVKLQLLDPAFSPSGLFQQVTPEFLVASVVPLGLLPPAINPLHDGCRDNGTIASSQTGDPCPVVNGRNKRLGVGKHTLFWRADSQVGLLDVLPPVYVPGTPPGS